MPEGCVEDGARGCPASTGADVRTELFIREFAAQFIEDNSDAIAQVVRVGELFRATGMGVMLDNWREQSSNEIREFGRRIEPLIAELRLKSNEYHKVFVPEGWDSVVTLATYLVAADTFSDDGYEDKRLKIT